MASIPTALRKTLAVGAGKLTASLVAALHLGAGTSLPGKVARKIDPHLLQELSAQIAGETIAVTGTNGKTTTCGLIAQFLQEHGKTLAHNQLGANMVPGITAELLKQSDCLGNLKVDMAVLEVDEASLRGVVAEASVQRIVVTNLFRDQLDRFGELNTTADFILKGIAKSKVNPSGCLYLNADDPLVAGMDLEAKRAVYYGVNHVEYQHPVESDCPVPFPVELTRCPRCESAIYLMKSIYGHLGHYDCLGCCGFDRPTPTVVADHVLVKPDESVVTVDFDGTRKTIHLPLPGLFNVYNFLAAASVAFDMGVPLEAIERGVANYHGVFGRAERKTLAGKNALIMLIKNPVGASEVLKQVGTDPKGRLLIALNDNYADGRDVSWIWDAQFEVISPEKPVVVSGVRAEDMAVRLKYAGIPADHITVEPDLKKAIETAAHQTQPDETLYILPTYSALLAMRDFA